jgi:hypothetical protein
VVSEILARKNAGNYGPYPGVARYICVVVIFGAKIKKAAGLARRDIAPKEGSDR